VLEFCQIDPSQLVILNENTIVEQLCLCEQGSHFGGHPEAWYLELLREFSTRRLESDPESLFLVSLRSVNRFFSTGTF
jgi:hypothetical protein